MDRGLGSSGGSPFTYVFSYAFIPSYLEKRKGTASEEAFKNLKRYLSSPPVLVAPDPQEELLLYIAVGPRAVSGVLVVKREETDKQEKSQRPVYYVSEVLHGPKKRYPQVQKLLYTVLNVSCKLRHYFQAHKIIIPSTFPLRDILHNRDAIGRIAKWAVELREFDIWFVPCTAIKLQVLADFIAEWTEPEPPQS